MGTFCLSGSVVLKAGKNVSTDLTDTDYEEFIAQAESYINTATRINFTDLYSGLNADVQKILEDAASSQAAISAISYDLFNYNSRAEAQTLLDVNYSRVSDIITLLKDKKQTDFIQGA